MATGTPKTWFVDSQSGSYDLNTQQNEYTREEGLLVLPVAGPTGSYPRVIRVHAPYGFRTVNWGMKKRGAPPVCPVMNDTPSGDMFLGSSLSLGCPTVGGGTNQLDWVVAGTYEYVQGASAGAAQPVRGPTEDADSYTFQTGTRPFQTSLFWMLVLGGGSTQGNYLGEITAPKSYTPEYISSKPDYKYLSSDLYDTFFSPDLIS